MTAWTESYLFGIVLSIFAFALGVFLNRKTRLPLFNPLLVATALVILVLSLLRIPLDNYRKGAKFISVFLAPATAALAVSIYNQRRILQKYFAPVLIGCLMGSLASMGSAYLLCKAFGLEDALVATMLPKSVTTPIAMAVSETLGGIGTVTAESYVVPCEQIGGLRINAFVKKEQIGFVWGCGCNSGRNRPGFGGCFICRQSIACKDIAKQQNRCKKQGDEFFHCY